MKEVVARLDDLPERELHPLIRGLSDAGADGRLAKVIRMLGNPERAVEALQREFEFELAEDPATRRRRLINGRFTTPDGQIENVYKWNAAEGLGLTPAMWDALPRPPAWPRGQHIPLVLVPHLATPELTGETLWRLAMSRQKSSWRDPRISFGKPLVRQFADASWTPGLRWVTVNLGANWVKDRGANWGKASGTAPSDLAGAEDDLLFAILAAAAQHPAWVRKMDGTTTPHVWVPGCRIMVEEDDHVVGGPRAICLGYDQGHREIMVSLDWPDGRDRRYAIPVLVS